MSTFTRTTKVKRDEFKSYMETYDRLLEQLDKLPTALTEHDWGDRIWLQNLFIRDTNSG